MKFKSEYFPYLVILILIGVIWFQGFERDVVTIEVPGEEGKFEPVTQFEYIIETDTIYQDRWLEKEVKVLNPVNQDLVDQYQKLKDSVGRLNMFLDAIMERQFKQTFEDDYLIGNVSGVVQGRLQELELDYKIKPRTIEAPQTRLRLLGGFNIGNEMDLSKFQWKASLGLQNGQGNIVRIGYGSRETIWLGYEASLIRF